MSRHFCGGSLEAQKCHWMEVSPCFDLAVDCLFKNFKLAKTKDFNGFM